MTSVLDSSAVLAVLFSEPGSGRVERALREGSVMSAVNVDEVVAKLAALPGGSSQTAIEIFESLSLFVVPFDRPLALASAGMRRATGDLGLGLADRACLATASDLGLPALTCDQAWVEAGERLSVRVELAR